MNADTWQLILSSQAGPFTLGELMLSFGIVLLTLFLRGLLTKVLFASLKKVASRTRWEHDDRFLEALEKPASVFILVLGIFLAAMVLPLDAEWAQLITTIFQGWLDARRVCSRKVISRGPTAREGPSTRAV